MYEISIDEDTSNEFCLGCTVSRSIYVYAILYVP